MKIYIGVTDWDWYQLLKAEKCDEVNFWTPSARNFKALQPNDLFLFKLHQPHNYIVGGGYFVRNSILPSYLAWDAFGIKNGANSLKELNSRIVKYKRAAVSDLNDLQIGCIILTEPFFFEENEWIPAPENFSKNIVQGKTYSTEEPVGQKLYSDVANRLMAYQLLNSRGIDWDSDEAENKINLDDTNNPEDRYAYGRTKHRLGQGAFRVMVTDAYQRRCAMTGERTLPVLQASHIKPYSQDGEHDVRNGILLRSDIHTLYDQGYITIDKDYRIDVSRRLNEDYGNGKDYYKHHGQKLLVLPENINEMPSKEMLEWHNENVFLG